MNKKGYGVMSIKREVIEEIQKRAKGEKKTISMYIAELLESEGKRKGKESILSKVFGGNGLTKEDLRIEIDKLKEALRPLIKEEVSNAIAEIQRF